MGDLFDLHVHAAPDVVPRRFDDTDTAAAYADAGFGGFVLKGHYDSTVGRAAAAARRSGVKAYGGVALNQHVGGINPAAAAAALAAGGRVVWFPTADAHMQATAGLPRLCGVLPTLGAHTYAIPPVDRAHAQAAQDVLRIASDHDAVVATGHLSADECHWLVREAGRLGVRRLLLTHPSFTVPDMGARAARELAGMGARVEVTAYQWLHQPGCSIEQLVTFIQAVGLEHVVLSSDAGQPDSPPAPQALISFMDALVLAGLDAGAVAAMAGERPAELVEP